MKLKKGTAYNYDLFITAIIFVISSLFGFPWLTAAVPHCALHVFALADVDSKGLIFRARETRVSTFCANGLIGLAIFGEFAHCVCFLMDFCSDPNSLVSHSR